MTDTYVYLIREKDWDSDSFDPTAGEMPPEVVEGFAEHQAFAEAVASLGARIKDGQALTSAQHGGLVAPGGAGRKVEDAVYTDSPYADSSELITGYYVVEVDSEEQARHIAALVPTGHAVEWRKVLPMGSEDA